MRGETIRRRIRDSHPWRGRCPLSHPGKRARLHITRNHTLRIIPTSAMLLLADAGGDKPTTDKCCTPRVGPIPPPHTLVREQTYSYSPTKLKVTSARILLADAGGGGGGGGTFAKDKRFTETKKPSPNTGARANNTLHE